MFKPLTLKCVSVSTTGHWRSTLFNNKNIKLMDNDKKDCDTIPLPSLILQGIVTVSPSFVMYIWINHYDLLFNYFDLCVTRRDLIGPFIVTFDLFYTLSTDFLLQDRALCAPLPLASVLWPFFDKVDSSSHGFVRTVKDPLGLHCICECGKHYDKKEMYSMTLTLLKI
jgi:hypothetical protein